jgi:hypothetical protein
MGGVGQRVRMHNGLKIHRTTAATFLRRYAGLSADSSTTGFRRKVRARCRRTGLCATPNPCRGGPSGHSRQGQQPLAMPYICRRGGTPVFGRGAASTDHPLQDLTSTMQRFPAAGLAEQEKRPSQSPPTNVASISPRRLSGFVTSQLLRGAGLCRSRPARKGRSFEGGSPFTGCFRRTPHPARSSDIRPTARGMD